MSEENGQTGPAKCVRGRARRAAARATGDGEGGLPVTGGALAGLVAAAMWAARRRKAPAEG